MKRPLLSLLLLLPALVGSLAAQGQESKVRMATVDMNRVFAEYPKTHEVAESIKGYSEEVQKERDERIESIREIAKEAESLKKEAEDPNLTGEPKRIAYNKSQLAQREVQQRAQGLQNWLQRKQAALIEKQNAEFDVIRDELVALVKEAAVKEGYDYVFDSSGGSSSGLSVLVFTKDAADITGPMLELTKKHAEAGTSAE
ncbi:MAG: OmpH family outer membrane protein [Verrucomicrobiales bacterium]